VVFSAGGNYGSAAFDAFDGTHLLAIVCDDCLMDRVELLVGFRSIRRPAEMHYFSAVVAMRGDSEPEEPVP